MFSQSVPKLLLLISQISQLPPPPTHPAPALLSSLFVLFKILCAVSHAGIMQVSKAVLLFQFCFLPCIQMN